MALALVLVVVSYLIAGPFASIFVIPVFSSLRDESRIFIARRLTKKGYSVDTADYISEVGAEILSSAEPTKDAETDTAEEAKKSGDGEN